MISKPYIHKEGPASQKIKIRKALKTDIRHIQLVLNYAIARKKQYKDNAWGSDPFNLDEVRHFLSNNEVFIATSGRIAKGIVGINWQDEVWAETTHDSGFIHKLVAVDSSEGIGAKLLSFAEGYIKRNDKQWACLDCPADNKKLCTYYEKHGYQLVRTVSFHSSNDSALYRKSLAN